MSQADFQAVFAAAHKVTRKSLIALYCPNQLGHARLGMVIPKHRMKLAVDRNWLRRVLRESFRHHQAVLKGLDIIILLRSECSPSASKKTLREDIDILWQQLLAASAKTA